MEIISVVPQGSVVGWKLSNVFLNNFPNINETESGHNFAINNNLSVFAKTIHELVHSLKLESKTAIK